MLSRPKISFAVSDSSVENILILMEWLKSPWTIDVNDNIALYIYNEKGVWRIQYLEEKVLDWLLTQGYSWRQQNESGDLTIY